MADGVIYNPFVAYVDRHIHAIGGIRGSSFASPWWLTWNAIHKPLVADGVVYKPLVACVERHSQAFGGGWSRLQAFGSLRGSPFASLSWQMESFTSLWWHAWIVVHKHLVADGALLKPFMVYVDRRLQAIGG